MSKKSEDSKAHILACAMNILNRDGARSITLDKVVKEAQISKGGLTHHFKSKHELLAGLLDIVFQGMTTALNSNLAATQSDTAAGRYTRAYMKTNLDSIRSGEAQSLRSLLEMLLSDPSLLEERKQELADIHLGFETDGLNPTHALMLASASDGCWLSVIIGAMEPGDPKIESLHEYLFAMSYQTGTIGEKGAKS